MRLRKSDAESESDCGEPSMQECKVDAKGRLPSKRKQLERSCCFGLRVNPTQFVPFQVVGDTKQTPDKLGKFCAGKFKSAIISITAVTQCGI